jgi:beta-lactam-binding protein with PASTA domain
VVQARQTLARSSLNLGQTAAVLDPSPAGTIFAQNPSPDAPAPPESQVNVSVSTGGIVVPDLTGDSRDDAQQALSSARLREGAIQTTESPEPAGQVIQQSPRGGAVALPESPVSLVLSAGTPQPARVRVPNLAGLSLQAASESLETSDLRVGTLQRQESSEPPGTVFDQNPAAETLVAPGKAVELFVSEVAAPANPVPVPDVQLGLQPASHLPWVIGGTGAVLGGALVFGLLNLRPKVIHAKPLPGLQYDFHRDGGTVRLRMTRPQPADQALRFIASHGHSRQMIVERSSRKG